MSTHGFATILGAFRISRRRATEEGKPGLTLWADAGELATKAVRDDIRTLAHRAEVADAEAESALERALADGQLDASDLPNIEAAIRNIRRSREADHQIGEVAS